MRAQASQCRYCRRVLTLHERYSGGVCSAPGCRAQVLNERLVEFRDHAARSLGLEDGDRISIAVIPHRAAKIAPLAAEQRSELEQHLRALALHPPPAASQAPAGACDGADDPRDEADPSRDAGCGRIAAAVCSACRGFCCYLGSVQHAFIDASTLQRYARAHPGGAPDDVVAAYLAHVPDRHFEGSCVYHAQYGCTLPRAMRSQTCNGYSCKGLRQAVATKADDPRRRCFVVARVDNRIVRGVMLDEHGSREVFDVPPGAGHERVDSPMS